MYKTRDKHNIYTHSNEHSKLKQPRGWHLKTLPSRDKTPDAETTYWYTEKVDVASIYMDLDIRVR